MLTAQTHLGTSPDVHAKFDPHANVEKLWVVFVMLYRPVSMKKKERTRESAEIDSRRRSKRKRRRNYVCMYFRVDVRNDVCRRKREAKA